MDQLIFASLSHTHYWYEVGMLKVPAMCTIPYHENAIYIWYQKYTIYLVPCTGVYHAVL